MRWEEAEQWKLPLNRAGGLIERRLICARSQTLPSAYQTCWWEPLESPEMGYSEGCGMAEPILDWVYPEPVSLLLHDGIWLAGAPAWSWCGHSAATIRLYHPALSTSTTMSSRAADVAVALLLQKAKKVVSGILDCALNVHIWTLNVHFGW